MPFGARSWGQAGGDPVELGGHPDFQAEGALSTRNACTVAREPRPVEGGAWGGAANATEALGTWALFLQLPQHR